MADVTTYINGFDLDTGAGTEFIQGVNLRISGAGGSIEAKGQQLMASSIPVVIASNQSAIGVTVGLPANPVTSYQTAAAIAAGAVGVLTTAEAASKKLAGVEVWSSVGCKVTVHTVDNGVESAILVIGGFPAFGGFYYKTSHPNYIALGATAGLDAFRVNVTNLDDANAADVYATFHYEDV